MLGIFAEFERAIINERTMNGRITKFKEKNDITLNIEPIVAKYI